MYIQEDEKQVKKNQRLYRNDVGKGQLRQRLLTATVKEWRLAREVTSKIDHHAITIRLYTVKVLFCRCY